MSDVVWIWSVFINDLFLFLLISHVLILVIFLCLIDIIFITLFVCFWAFWLRACSLSFNSCSSTLSQSALYNPLESCLHLESVAVYNVWLLKLIYEWEHLQVLRPCHRLAILVQGEGKKFICWTHVAEYQLLRFYKVQVVIQPCLLVVIILSLSWGQSLWNHYDKIKFNSQYLPFAVFAAEWFCSINNQ